jgi:hypothetical protein
LNKLFGEKLRKIAARENNLIRAVLVDLSPFEELPPTENYELSIYLLFDEAGDPVESEGHRNRVGARKAFHCEVP